MKHIFLFRYIYLIFIFSLVLTDFLIISEAYGSEKLITPYRQPGSRALPFPPQQISPVSNQNPQPSPSSRKNFILSPQRTQPQNIIAKQNPSFPSSLNQPSIQEQASKKTIEWQSKNYSPSLDRIGAQKILQNTLEQDTTGMKERRYEASQGRAKQEFGQKISDKTEKVSETLGEVSDIVSLTGEPYGETAGSALSIISTSIKWGGKGIGAILTALGRYQERMQNIFTVNEQLIEMAQQSFEKMEELSKALTERVEFLTLSKVFQEKPKGQTGSSKPSKKKLLYYKTWKNTIHSLLDKTYLTDYKGQRWEEIKILQEQLKVEQNTFEDYVRLLQIRILEEAIKDIGKILNKDKTVALMDLSIDTLRKGQKVLLDKMDYQDLMQKAISRGGRTNIKEVEKLHKIIKEYATKIKNEEDQRNYYATFLLNEEKIMELNKYREALTAEKDELYQLTNLYRSRENSDEEVKRESTTEEVKNLKKQMEIFQIELNAMKEQIKVLSVQKQSSVPEISLKDISSSPVNYKLLPRSIPPQDQRNTTFGRSTLKESSN